MTFRHDVLTTDGDTSWFVKDRFGMFIHWGLYALPARHEWVQHRESIPAEDYDRYFKHFDPDLYEPKLWADAAYLPWAASLLTGQPPCMIPPWRRHVRIRSGGGVPPSSWPA